MGTNIFTYFNEDGTRKRIIKQAVYISKDGTRKHIIEQIEDGAITVSPQSWKSVLRLIFADMGEHYDEKWTARDLGDKLIGLVGNSTTYVTKNGKTKIDIKRKEGGSVVTKITPKTILQLIFADLGEDFEESWDVNTLGVKLIELLNESASETMDSKLIGEINALADEEADEDEEVAAEERWQWWVNLNCGMKLLLLYRWKDLVEDEEFLPNLANPKDKNGIPLIYYDREAQTNKDNDDLQYLLSDFIMATDGLDVADTVMSGLMHHVEQYLENYGEYEDIYTSVRQMEGLAYLPNLTYLSFYKDQYVAVPPKGLDKLTNLKYIDFSRSDLADDMGDEVDEVVDELIKIVKALPNLKACDISSTLLERYLEEAPHRFEELKRLAPNCSFDTCLAWQDEDEDEDEDW